MHVMKNEQKKRYEFTNQCRERKGRSFGLNAVLLRTKISELKRDLVQSLLFIFSLFNFSSSNLSTCFTLLIFRSPHYLSSDICTFYSHTQRRQTLKTVMSPQNMACIFLRVQWNTVNCLEKQRTISKRNQLYLKTVTLERTSLFWVIIII